MKYNLFVVILRFSLLIIPFLIWSIGEFLVDFSKPIFDYLNKHLPDPRNKL